MNERTEVVTFRFKTDDPNVTDLSFPITLVMRDGRRTYCVVNELAQAHGTSHSNTNRHLDPEMVDYWKFNSPTGVRSVKIVDANGVLELIKIRPKKTNPEVNRRLNEFDRFVRKVVLPRMWNSTGHSLRRSVREEGIPDGPACRDIEVVTPPPVHDDRGSTSIFDDIKHVDEHGNEYWLAREMMVALEYSAWPKFQNVINRAIANCRNSSRSINPEDHFAHISYLVEVGSSAMLDIGDVRMTKAGCYLVAANADPTKPRVADAKIYFVESADFRDSAGSQAGIQDDDPIDMALRSILETRERVKRLASDVHLRIDREARRRDEEARRLEEEQARLRREVEDQARARQLLEDEARAAREEQRGRLDSQALQIEELRKAQERAEAAFSSGIHPSGPIPEFCTIRMYEIYQGIASKFRPSENSVIGREIARRCRFRADSLKIPESDLLREVPTTFPDPKTGEIRTDKIFTYSTKKVLDVIFHPVAKKYYPEKFLKTFPDSGDITV